MNHFQPQERVTKHFGDAANVYYSWYDTRNPSGHSFRIRRTRCLELLRSLPQGGIVADIGCGPGTFTEALLQAGFQMIATDIAPSMIEDAQKRFQHEPKATFAVAPADQIPTPDGTLDGVTAMGLVEYLNDEEAVYQDIYRALKPGGIALITYPHYWSPTRIWDRITHALVKPLLRLIRGKPSVASGVKHREYQLHTTVASLEQQGFLVQDTVFYNFKLGFRPIEHLFPRSTVWLSERLERFCRTPILRRIGTGFILRVKKPS